MLVAPTTFVDASAREEVAYGFETSKSGAPSRTRPALSRREP